MGEKSRSLVEVQNDELPSAGGIDIYLERHGRGNQTCEPSLMTDLPTIGAISGLVEQGVPVGVRASH